MTFYRWQHPDNCYTVIRRCVELLLCCFNAESVSLTNEWVKRTTLPLWSFRASRRSVDGSGEIWPWGEWWLWCWHCPAVNVTDWETWLLQCSPKWSAGLTVVNRIAAALNPLFGALEKERKSSLETSQLHSSMEPRSVSNSVSSSNEKSRRQPA